jgi:hypothetical protein
MMGDEAGSKKMKRKEYEKHLWTCRLVVDETVHSCPTLP